MRFQKKDLTPFKGARFKHSSLIYKDFLYVYGGSTKSNEVLLDLWRYDLSAFLSNNLFPYPSIIEALSWEKIPHTFSDAPPVITRASYFCATVFENNLIFGSAEVTPYAIDFFTFEISQFSL